MVTKTAPVSKSAAPAAAPHITHHGMISFDFVKGLYSRASGTDNWIVRPIDWPGVPGPPPVGQVMIQFNPPVPGPYTVVVSACRTADAPMIAANYGDVSNAGFVVVIFDPVATMEYRTVRNGNFSFIVVQ
jgi:hypothetical protein